MIFPSLFPVAAALEHGYAVLVVSPLRPRHVHDNCVGRPLPIAFGRLLEDAFDAAEHLRNQSFVDPARVGLFGFSQGGMVSLAASGSNYSEAGGRPPFAAIVSGYPICIFENGTHPLNGQIVDMYFVPDTFVVPTLVELGAHDEENGTPMNGCQELLAAHKDKGEPIDYVIYQAGHAWDMNDPTGEATRRSVEDTFTFLNAHLKSP